MPWLRSGDNAATHPIVMRVASLARDTRKVDEREIAINEVFGFVTRCALQTAGHTMSATAVDYTFDEGTAWMIGGARTERLIELAVGAGYIKPKRRRSIVTYVLVDDPEFLHMRTKTEIERERQRKADNGNKAITGPVRLRDGDECRYCARVVNWNDRKSTRGATYDHREGLGKRATVRTLVVACLQCNASRGDDPDADERHPLMPEPTEPVYSATTATFLLDAGYRVTATEGLRPGSQPDNAHSDPATSGTTRTPTQSRAPVTRAQHSGNGPHAPPRSADIEHPGSGFAGTGRVGSADASRNPPSNASSAHGANRRRRRSPRGRTPPGASQ